MHHSGPLYVARGSAQVQQAFLEFLRHPNYPSLDIVHETVT